MESYKMIPFWGIRLFYLLPIEPLNVSSVINMQPNKYLLFQVDTASQKALKMKLLRIYKGLSLSKIRLKELPLNGIRVNK